MRFTIRDLLLITTICAVYVAAIAKLHDADLLDMSWRLRGIFIQAAFLAWSLRRGFLIRRRLGANAVRFRRSRATLYHLIPLLGLAFFVACAMWDGGGFRFWPIMTLLVVCHLGAEITSNILVGDAGIAAHIELLPWDEYEFEIDGNRLVCLPTFNPHIRKTERYSFWQEDAEVLRNLLADKQTPGVKLTTKVEMLVHRR